MSLGTLTQTPRRSTWPFAFLLTGVLALAPASSLAQAPDRIDLPDGWQPEGITRLDTTLLLGSLADGAVLAVDSSTGVGTILVPGTEGSVAVGVEAEPAAGRVWVAGGPTGEVRVEGRVCRTVVAVVALVSVAAPSMSGPIPSKADDTREADLATVESFLARDEVAQALAANGLSPDEVEQRLARLSAEDLSALAANVDQIQSAGQVPNYIWILLAILIGVTILATVF